MYKRIKNIILFSLLTFGLFACGPGDDKAKPDPEPPPPPPVPAPPQGTDYSKTGEHGKIGVKTREEEPRVIDVDTKGWITHGSKMGSSFNDRERWDTTQDLKKCPRDPIYVVSYTTENSVPQCADGKGYGAICKNSAKKAWKRAMNVIRSCERVPGCRGRVAGSGQEWMCRAQVEIDEDGNNVGAKTWIKRCSTQYKVVCFTL